MEKWEYKTTKIETTGFNGGILAQEDFENDLNRMGSQGWELVSCFDTSQAYGRTREVVAVFKRRMSI